MNRFTRRLLGISLVLAATALHLPARADGVDIDAKAKEAAKSLVIVDFTLRNENTSRQGSGQGIVLNKDGVILISDSLISESLPKEWITDIKVRPPGKNFEPTPAKLLGRTRNRLFAYLKTDTPVDAPPFEPGTTGELKLGEPVFSVGIYGQAGGYSTYVGKSEVRVILPMERLMGNTASFGLTRGTSPVYDATDGNFLGITLPTLAESMILRLGDADQRIELVDPDQSATFLPVSEVTAALSDVPSAPFDLRRPWLAIDESTGLGEDVRALKKIDQPSGVVVGSVIAGENADKAGLKPRDIILTVDGKQFSTSPVPDLMVAQFERVLDDKKPGDKLTLGIMRDGQKLEIPVTLSETPRSGAEMKHVFSPLVGITTRDLVFSDAYSRRLPQDTKGVMVALVKNGSPASLGSTPLSAGFLITKVDDQPVDNQQQFLDILQKESQKTDLKELVFVVIQPTGQTQVCRVDLTK